MLTIHDDPTYGSNSYMKVSLIFENPPASLEEMGGLWLGIGFGKFTMLGADLVICQWNDTSLQAWCKNYLANANTHPLIVPAASAVQNVWTVSGYKADNKVVLTFKRFLQPSDSASYSI